jgi:hypothetical protein
MLATVRRTLRSGRHVVALLALALAACGDGAAPTAPRPTPGTPTTPSRIPVGAVVLTPIGPELLVTGSRQIAVEIRATNGTVLHDRAITWTSSDPEVATITGEGVVWGARVGTATIRATVEGVTSELVISVAPVVATRLTVRTPQLHTVPGTLVTPDVMIQAADGRVLLDRPVTVTIDDATIVGRDAQGRLVAAAPGFTTIRYAVDGLSAQVGVFVQPHPTAGRWRLTAWELVGAGTRCVLEGMILTVARDGSAIFAPATSGMRSECQLLPGGQPPYATPTPPDVNARVTVDGATVRVTTSDARWQLRGTMATDGRTIGGEARVVDDVWESGIAPIRTGHFSLQRLDD